MRKVTVELNYEWDPLEPRYVHVDKKWRNNRIESDHAALKRLIGPTKGFKKLHSAKSTLRGIEAIRAFKHKHIRNVNSGAQRELEFVQNLFQDTA